MLSVPVRRGRLHWLIGISGRPYVLGAISSGRYVSISSLLGLASHPCNCEILYTLKHVSVTYEVMISLRTRSSDSPSRAAREISLLGVNAATIFDGRLVKPYL